MVVENAIKKRSGSGNVNIGKNASLTLRVSFLSVTLSFVFACIVIVHALCELICLS